ncbi:MAG: hypothetical protein ACRDT9_02970 [Agromyces sp.]
MTDPLATELLAKLTLTPYRDQEFTLPAGPPWVALVNPAQLAQSRKNLYSSTSPIGASAPHQQYSGSEPESVTLDLFFDGTGVVAGAAAMQARLLALFALMKYQSDIHSPYYLRALWGAFVLQCVMTQADVTYTLFDRLGLPLRATVKVTLQEIVAPRTREAQEKKNSPDLYQTWVVMDDESLDRIANEVYGDPGLWRELAAANELPTGLRPPAGTRLLLPPLEGGR